MNWEAASAIAEIAAAVAVIASIIYLALQIRQNTLSNRITARHIATDHIVSVIDFNLEHPELADIQMRGRMTPERLAENERYPFFLINRRYMYFYSSMWLQYQLGALQESEWWECLYLIRNSWLRYPGHRAWWRSYRDSANPEFRAFVDAELARAGYGEETISFDDYYVPPYRDSETSLPEKTPADE